MTPILVIVIFAHYLLSLPALAQFDANCQGNRKVIVQLFEWRWRDIADECDRFLSKKGYCGVLVSPPNEHRVVMNKVEKRPWWERYQPVSYKTYTRSGDGTAFYDMITRCNSLGVRIYVDVVMNHMVSEDSGVGVGTNGSTFNSQTSEFLSVPYNSSHFHIKGKECKTNTGRIESYDDPAQVRNCRLNGLLDLNQNDSYVRQKLSDWLNYLINLGAAGFRFQGAKYMEPADIKAIIGMLNPLSTRWFREGSNAFIYQDVVDLGGEPIKAIDYSGYARVAEYNYGKYLSESFNGRNQLKHLKILGEGYGYLMSAFPAVVFIDTPENQRGYGAGGGILNFFNPRQLKLATTFMLAWRYGQAIIMSSYRWERKFKGGVDQNDWIGPPHDESWNILPATVKNDGTCDNGWVCEHRWRSIANMVQFRNVGGDFDKLQNWWDDGDNQIAFSWGNKGFYAVNAGQRDMLANLQTGMKPGRYCDVISGERTIDGYGCNSGKIIVVDSDGYALISISAKADEPMIAIHVESILGDSPNPVTAVTLPPVTPPPTYHRTVIFMYFRSQPWENLFLNGGIDHVRREDCKTNMSLCWIPISYAHIYYPAKHYDAYNAWSQGDNYLGWEGAEPGQGTYQDQKAEGSPMVWTTNYPPDDIAYHPLNTWSPHYWMIDISVDCSATVDGWFEVKANVNGRWEHDINQDAGSTCPGTAGSIMPFQSINHVVRCGYKNVFVWEQASCEVDMLPS